jgi:hypothetical protein
VSANDRRSALERLIPELPRADEAAPTVGTFLRGVAIGALVGAAIAGSAMLGRRRGMSEAEGAETSEGSQPSEANEPVAEGPGPG